ncbi:GlxA family transcriptional regulator [Marinivivus vitaminiproducens]|uniref:GlxA family transcriptional regulator n=1 Tax=Marinivivus vitaminiproducens TaxID=3035935 RepID=UPI00279F46AC|nr:helix-turn-helix domain-containing protein [Geminicoccaceae bacterium SCSIO 64248]
MTTLAAGRRVIPVLMVLPPRTLLLDVAGPIEALRKANLVQDRIRFDVVYAGASSGIVSSIGLELGRIGALPQEVAAGTIVVLSGSASSVLGGTDVPGQDDRAKDDAIVAWLRRAVDARHSLVSICSGALLAGRAGLLDGRLCTTHHACAAELSAVAPRATVVQNRLFVEDGPVLTSAGVTAGIDLMLHLIARLAGPACALAVARYLVVYLRRSGTDPQLSPWLEGRNHIHPAVHRVQDAIAAEPARHWSLGDLATVAAASPRHLSRLFNEHVGMSVTDYISRLRVALAQELIAQTRLGMEHVAEQAGFASSRQLRRAWARLHAEPPSRARTAAL